VALNTIKPTNQQVRSEQLLTYVVIVIIRKLNLT